VDIRGFGASEGRPTEREYSELEQVDGEQVISLARDSTLVERQRGYVWDFLGRNSNALQMAMRNPPELKAIIATDATEELFHDDIHYIDGMMHIDEFELNMDMAPGMTGAPDYTLKRECLGPRFDAPPWSLLYLKHQRDGVFLAKSRASAERDQGTVLFDRRTGGWLPGQHSPDARTGESAGPSAARSVEPFVSERR